MYPSPVYQMLHINWFAFLECIFQSSKITTGTLASIDGANWVVHGNLRFLPLSLAGTGVLTACASCLTHTTPPYPTSPTPPHSTMPTPLPIPLTPIISYTNNKKEQPKCHEIHPSMIWRLVL